ncbi:unnamed protein product, partial [Rotaria sordida]
MQDAQRKAEEQAKEEQRLQEEELKRLEQEKLRLEEEHREKMKQHEGLNLTRKQRHKRRHIQIQMGATGVQISEHHVSQSATSNDDKSIKKGILYDDRRKINKT